jgi:DNA primase
MLTPEQQLSLDTAVNHYAAQVEGAAGYLGGRGIGPKEAAMFRLGFVRDPLPGHERYVGKLVIPYMTPAGAQDFRFRCLADHDCKEHGHGKYLSRAGVEPGLYNVPALWVESSFLAVCEGEIDTITMNRIMPSVGLPGVQSWKSHYSRLMADYDKVYVMCDGDDAGWGFGDTVMRAVEDAVAIRLPDGMDVNKLWQTAGPDALRSLIGWKVAV